MLEPTNAECGIATSDDPVFAGALDRARAHLREHATPGAAIVVVRDGAVEAVAGVGSKLAEDCDPVTPTTLFRTFIGMHAVSAAAVAAVEAGELALDAPITDRVPEFGVAPPGDPSRTTLRHLLTHTSGFGRELAGDCLGLEDWLRANDALPQWALPGTIYLWEPVNSTVVARALAFTGEGGFEAAMQRWLYQALGIRATYDPVRALKGDLALGYTRRDQDLIRAAIEPRRCGAQEPYAGLFASAEDTAALLAYLARGDAGARLTADAGPAFDAPDRATLSGLFRGPLTDDIEWVAEDVHAFGYGYAIRIVPARDIAIAVLVNASHGEADLLAESLIELYTGLEPSFAGAPTLPDDYPTLLGTYRDELAGRTLRVDFDGEALTAELVGRVKAVRLAPASRYGNERYGFATDVFDLASEEASTRIRFWRDERGVALTVSEDTIRRALGPPLHRLQ